MYTIIHLSLLIHKQPSHALSSSNTHASNQNLLIRPLRLVQHSTDLSRSRSSQRVTKRNCTTARVHLSMVQTEVVQAIHRHRGECLVDFEDVNVVLGQVELAQELGDRGCRSDTHDTGRDTSDSGAAEFGEDGLVQLNGLGAAHEKDGGSCNHQCLF